MSDGTIQSRNSYEVTHAPITETTYMKEYKKTQCIAVIKTALSQ